MDRTRPGDSQPKAADACQPDNRKGLDRRKFLQASGLAGLGMLAAPVLAQAGARRAESASDAASGQYDSVIVGSGVNSLAAAAILARAGWRVCVLERNDRLGGCIRTEELTLPGFKHDVFSSWHPLFVTSPVYAELKNELHQNGLEFANSDYPTAVVLPDGRNLVFKRSREENVKAMNQAAPGDGDAYQKSMAELARTAPLTFGLLGKNLWSWGFAKMMASQAWDMGLHNLMSYFGAAFQNSRGWLENNFRSDLCRALLAPWVLHTGLGPESALSGFMDRLIFFTLEIAGMPVVKGGGYGLVKAFVKYIESKNGRFVVKADVDKILTQGKKAVGVRTKDGKTYTASRAVLCNVTPEQLYLRLLDPKLTPAKVADQARRYRFGRGDMQIHIALNEPPQWPNPELGKVAMVHVTPGLDGVSRAVNQAENGLLPAEATIVTGQPTALDPSRAPQGKAILWLQLQELPSQGKLKGDAMGEIAAPADGKWTVEVAEKYADRIIDRLARHIPNLKSAMLARKVLSPADLAQANINLVGGDPYSGACSLDQFFFWRPLRAVKNHSTPVEGLYQIGASTHPGPGLGGVSGLLTAKELLD